MNSPKGFIGCLNAGTWSDWHFTIYCVAMQVPSSGPDAGRLTTDAWSCQYHDSSVDYTDSHVVLAPSALRVRPDGSFTFSAHIPHIGRVSVAGVGGQPGDFVAPASRVIGPPPDGYRPQGYSLASPTQGLATYGLDHTFAADTSAIDHRPSLYRIAASVNGHTQQELIGTVWHAPTSGEWDFETC